MSKYTVEVRFLCETYAGYTESQGLKMVDEIIDKAIPEIFGNYPIFDEAYRNVLNHKIIRHFYTQEICAETPALWIMWLNTRLEEIMPYYNQLYQSELIKFNPMYDADYFETNDIQKKEDKNLNTNQNRTLDEGSKTTTGSDSKSNDETNNELRVDDTSGQQSESVNQFSATPQGSLSQSDLFGKYLTDIRKINDSSSSESTGHQVGKTTSETTTTATSDSNSTHNLGEDTAYSLTHQINNLDKYVKHVSGKMPGHSYSKLLQEFRDTFLNIDTEIIEQLQDLFMGLW